MSEKVKAITNMVFYAQQNPEALANVIASLVTDAVTSIDIKGDASIKIPDGDTSSTATYTAKALSQFGDEMANTVTLALNSSVTGVSISGGTVSVAKTATSDSFVLKATCGTVTQLMTVTLIPANA